MKTFFFSVFALLLISAGCSISQEYHFNSDMSGNSTAMVDVSQMKEFMSGMDSTGNDNSMDTMDQSFAKVAETYRQLGAKNIEYGWNDDSTVLFISYDFDNVDVVNKVMASGADSELMGGATPKTDGKKAEFKAKGEKKLSYTAPDFAKDTTMNSEEMASMKDYYQYKLSFTFEREIKKLDNKNAVMAPDGKSFEFSGSMFDILSPEYKTDFKVKLK